MKMLMNANAGITWGQQVIKSGLQVAAVMVGAIVATGGYAEFMAKGPIEVLWNPFFVGVASSLTLFVVDNVGAKR
jgi:hypothetical protein